MAYLKMVGLITYSGQFCRCRGSCAAGNGIQRAWNTVNIGLVINAVASYVSDIHRVLTITCDYTCTVLSPLQAMSLEAQIEATKQRDHYL